MTRMMTETAAHDRQQARRHEADTWRLLRRNRRADATSNGGQARGTAGVVVRTSAPAGPPAGSPTAPAAVRIHAEQPAPVPALLPVEAPPSTSHDRVPAHSA